MDIQMYSHPHFKTAAGFFLGVFTCVYCIRFYIEGRTIITQQELSELMSCVIESPR